MIILGAQSMAKIEVIVNKMAVVFPVEYPRSRKLLFRRSLYTMIELRMKKEAGHQVNCKAVDPDEDVMHWCAYVVFNPNVGPPVVGNAGQKAGDVDTYNDFSSASRVGDCMILKRMAHSYIPIDG